MLKVYPKTLQPDPKRVLIQLLLNKRGVTSGPAVSSLPHELKNEAIEIAQQRGMIGSNFQEAAYWIINDLVDYPRCTECGAPVKFRSYSEAYMYDRCSTRCSNGSKNVKNKKKVTTLLHYGTEHHFAATSIKEKMKQTNLQLYGVESNMQRPDVYHRNMESQYRKKKHVLPSGKIVKLMGYEPYVIDWLINTEFCLEDDISFDVQLAIKYLFDNEERIYYPDFWIKTKNLLVEVKSSYTWNADKVRNIAKLQAAKNSGYSVKLIIWDKRKQQPLEIKDF
jgi:hypothetical protein